MRIFVGKGLENVGFQGWCFFFVKADIGMGGWSSWGWGWGGLEGGLGRCVYECSLCLSVLSYLDKLVSMVTGNKRVIAIKQQTDAEK